MREVPFYQMVSKNNDHRCYSRALNSCALMNGHLILNRMPAKTATSLFTFGSDAFTLTNNKPSNLHCFLAVYVVNGLNKSVPLKELLYIAIGILRR